MKHESSHKSCPPVPILSQTNPVPNTPSCLYTIHCNITHALTSWFCSFVFLSGFPTTNLHMLHFHICAACPAHLTLIDLTILIILGEEYKLQSSSLCSFFPPSRHFISLRSKYSPQHPVLKHPQSLFSHPYRARDTITVLHILIFVCIGCRLKDRRFWIEW
jgi:hypothetical protein